MEFHFIPLKEALSESACIDLERTLTRVLSVESSLRAGGWICGGFARHLLLDRPARAYFEETKRPGDIDVFFNSVAQARAAIPVHATPSHAGFAKETRSTVKVQFVDHPDLIKPTITETLLSFDIVNCRVAINHEFAVVPDGWRDLEASKLLQLGRIDTPFLGGRLLKYLEHRGLDGLTDDSYEKLTSWLAQAANDFNETGAAAMHIVGAQGHVKRLRERGLVKREDLIFFIGKWKQVIYERSYGSSLSHEVDWALNELSNNLGRADQANI